MLTQLVMQWDLFRSSNPGNRFLDPRCIFFAEEGTVRARFFAFVLTHSMFWRKVEYWCLKKAPWYQIYGPSRFLGSDEDHVM